MKISARIPAWRYPEASERALSRRLQEATRDLVVEMRDRLDSLKFDATNEEIEEAESDIEERAFEIFMAVIAGLAAVGLTVYRFNSQQWLAIALAAGGKDNPAIMTLKQNGPIGAEPWYQEKLERWQGVATTSVRKLANDIVSDWSIKVKAANAKGASREDIDDIIEERYAIYGSWSKNRASGIIGTFSSMLMMQRLVDAKVSHYFWFGVMDDRERESHVKLEGARRPVNGKGIFPGEEYGCRCWAVPDFKNIEVRQ
nr:head morphogenesis [Klebsiella phage vB_Ko_K29PH164C1]